MDVFMSHAIAGLVGASAGWAAAFYIAWKRNQGRAEAARGDTDV